MKHLLTVIAATSALAVSAGDVTGITSQIAPYVYPANYPAAAPQMLFMPDGESYLQLSDDSRIVKRYETASGKELETVFDAASTRETRIESVDAMSLSADGRKLLLATDEKSLYRRSSDARWYTFDIHRNILRPLSKEHPRQQSPVFSPDGRNVAFAAGGNIYIRKLDYDSEVAATTDGAEGKIINGTSDWTYEEEFETTCSMIWSADSRTLSYIKYNETDVPLYSLPLYEGSCEPMEQYALYPGLYTYKYPVAGKPNSIVTLHSYDLSNRKTLDLPLSDPNIEYIPRIISTDDASGTFLAVTLDRDQRRMEVYKVNPRSTVSHSLIVEEYKAWLLPATYENLQLDAKGNILILSSRSGYAHVYQYSSEGALLRQITSGDYDVTACYGSDNAGNVYVQTARTSPICRTVTRIDAKGRSTDLTASDGWGSASFSPALNYAVVTHSSATVPPVVSLMAPSSAKTLRILEDNAEYAARYASVPHKEFITVTSDGVSLNGYILRPPHFNATKRYPVIMWQYGGPGSQQVTDRWAMDWDYFAAEQGFVVVCVDPRGTGARGRDFMDIVYRRLGYYETIDQLNVARWVASQPWADADRIGLAGWSYGGYETLMCVTDPASPFAAAVAIAPVTDWRYYDTIYTERYMLTPQANPDGYNESAPVSRASHLNCRLLLMSGTADDNVHPANMLEFAARLQAHGILCDMLLMPNQNHSIFGCNYRAIVYGKMLEYFKRSLLH